MSFPVLTPACRELTVGVVDLNGNISFLQYDGYRRG